MITYQLLREHGMKCVIHDGGDNIGVVQEASFGYVMVNWNSINPEGTPPICYPSDLFEFYFFDYEIEERNWNI